MDSVLGLMGTFMEISKSVIKNRAFTLIECLVALVIIAIVLASSTRAIGMAINDAKDSYTREIASWVAENLINYYYIDGVFPDLGNKNMEVSMAALDFIVVTNVTTTPNPLVRRIEVSVAEKKRPNYYIFNFSNLYSQY